MMKCIAAVLLLAGVSLALPVEKQSNVAQAQGKFAAGLLAATLLNRGGEAQLQEMAQAERVGGFLRNLGRNVGRRVGGALIDEGANALRDLLPREMAQVQRFRNVLRNIGRTVGREVVNVGRDAARDLGNRLIDRGSDALRDLLPRAQLQQISDEDLVEMLNLLDLIDQDQAEAQLGAKLRG